MGRKKLTRIMVIPDTHVPDHDPLAWNTAIQCIKAAAPDVVVFIGDFADYWSISRHAKSAERVLRFREETAAVNEELDRIERLGISRVVYCEGNHEERLGRFIDERAPELVGIVSNEQLFRIKERGWEWVPYRQHIRIGKMHFAHEVGPCGIHATRNSLTAFQHPIVIGHSHRAGVEYGGSVRGDRHVAMSVGCLIDLKKVRYTHRSNIKDWQHAIGDIHQDETGVSWCNVIPIISGRAVVDGRVVSGRKSAPRKRAA